MSDLNHMEKEIGELIESCTKELKGLTKKDPSQRLKQLSRCQNKIAEIKTRVEDYELEVLQLEKGEQPKYKSTLDNFKKSLKTLRSDLSTKKAEKGGDGNPLTEGLLSKELDQMNDIELVKVGDEYQQKGKDAVGRILANIENANQRADNINLELQIQDEKIQKATEKAKDVQSQTKIAMQYVKYFARQVYTDKILMCLIFLCAIAVIVIIVLKFTKKNTIVVTADQIKKSFLEE